MLEFHTFVSTLITYLTTPLCYFCHCVKPWGTTVNNAWRRQNNNKICQVRMYCNLYLTFCYSCQIVIFCINSLRTGIILIWFWLLNVVDRSHNIMILGHAILKHTILCTGDMMAHTFAFCRSRMLCLAVSKRDLTVFLSHSKRKCLCRNKALLLFLVSGVRRRV
jgi:hypothetical protein